MQGRNQYWVEAIPNFLGATQKCISELILENAVINATTVSAKGSKFAIFVKWDWCFELFLAGGGNMYM